MARLLDSAHMTITLSALKCNMGAQSCVVSKGEGRLVHVRNVILMKKEC
jgi:hypothetical protein